MIQIRNFITKISGDGKNHIIADIDVDTSTDLPTQEFENYFFEMGSIARDISTGDFYSIDSSGEWHLQSGGSE